MINIGLVGCGIWGVNYVNTLWSIPGVMVKYICDTNEASLQKVRMTYPNIKTTRDYHELLEDEDLDGVIIATPPRSHFGIAVQFLSRNKAVLVEKPCTLSCQEADSLINLAHKNQTVLMAGHLMEYHPVVLTMQEQVKQGQLGKLRYMLMERAHLANLKDVGVHWDLTVHDLSIIRCLINQNPLWVAAHGVSHRQSEIYDLVVVTIVFSDDLLVQINTNCISPIKRRQVVLSGENMAMVFDDTADSYKLQLISSKGDITMPKFERNLPLTKQCMHFVECIKTKVSPKTGDVDIAWVTKAASLVEQSLLRSGEKLCWDGRRFKC